MAGGQEHSADVGKLRKQVSTLAKFGGRALRTDDIDQLLQEATQLVSEALDVDLVKVLELLPDGQNLLVRAGVNWRPGVVGHATIPALAGSAAGHALRTNTPVISDVETEKRFSIPQLLIDHGVRSTVNVVIRGEDGSFGVLEVDSREHRQFGQDDIDFLQNYANLLASAVDRLNSQRELASGAEKQKVLLHELQHRVNNLLTTIRAMARRTRARSTSLNQFAKSFDERLAALARIHNLLSRPDRAAVAISEILSEELLAQGAIKGENFTHHGPEMSLTAKQALVLSMAFHELATNAVKHGALAANGGRIGVTWSSSQERTNRQVRITWRELGVRIDTEPVRRGHGSEIMEKSIPHMLQGTLDRTFHPDGLECVISFPIENDDVR